MHLPEPVRRLGRTGPGRRLKLFLNGAHKALDVKRRHLRTVSMLVTDRCSSRCKHCFIWAKKPNHDLAPETIARLLEDDVISRRTYFELTGGEFLEHPGWRDILALFRAAGNDYMMLSHGLFPERVIEAVTDYRVPNLYMSLDGLGETYKKVRGVDGAGNVLRLIDELSGRTNIFIAYTITPWNSGEDLAEIRALCAERGVSFFIGAYQTPEYFDTRKPGSRLEEREAQAVSEFMRLHNGWMDGRVSLPCWNITTKCYVMPNGEVHLCQQKSLVLGNLYEQPLGAIWRSPEVQTIHHTYRDCNECWLACNRPFDAELAHSLRAMLPRRLLDRFIGRHSWDEVHDAYSKPAPDGQP